MSSPGGSGCVAAVVTTLAGSGTGTWIDGSGTVAAFNKPIGLALDANNNAFVVELNNNRVRLVTPIGGMRSAVRFGPQSGQVELIVCATCCSFPFFHVASASVLLLFSVVSTLAGGNNNFALIDGMGTAAAFNGLYGIAFDPQGNALVTDSGNQAIRRVAPNGCAPSVFWLIDCY